MTGSGTRADVIQQLLDGMRNPIYVEIGVKSGATFFAVRAALKLGVDPAFRGPARRVAHNPLQLLNRGPLTRAIFGARLFDRTSDDFFTRYGGALAQLGIDVAFVDGEHSYAQSLRDVENCLAYLRPGGVVLVDDCNPASLASATHPREAAEKVPGYTGDWCGDVYKTIVHLRTRRDDLDVFVLDCVHGLGVVRKKAGSFPQPHAAPDLVLDYESFARDREKLLNLRGASAGLA